MRKLVMLAVAVMVVFAAPAALATHQKDANSKQVCGGTGQNVGASQTGGVANVNANGNTSGGHLSAQSCDDAGADGNVSIGGQGSSSGVSCFYANVEGDATNGSQADGYVGIKYTGSGTPQVLTPADGEFPHCATP